MGECERTGALGDDEGALDVQVAREVGVQLAGDRLEAV